MRTITFIALLGLCFVSSNAVAQNNHIDNPLIYYNMKDTSNSTPPIVCRLPILELTDSIVMDSLQQYVKDARKNGYGQFEDSNGVYITMGFGYNSDDTANIYIYISAIENYYLQALVSR